MTEWQSVRRGKEPCTEHDECKESPAMAEACVRFRFRRMTDDDLRQFVDGVVSGQIFTVHHMSEVQRKNNLHHVFMPLAFQDLESMGFYEEDIANIGTIWEHITECGPSINGMPIFFSMRVMHKDDWARASAAIERERTRRGRIEV